MIRHDFFQAWREAGFPTTIVDLTLAMIEDRLRRLAVAAVGGAELLATSDVAALRAAVDLAPFTVSADEEKSKAFLTAADCLAEDCGGGFGHKTPRRVDIRDRRWQDSGIVFCASESELQSVAPVVDAAGAIYFSASADHIREKSGGKRAFELDRDPGIRRVTPSAMIMAVLGGVQIYSLLHDRGQSMFGVCFCTR
jgi:hypothetical protein